MAEPNVNVSSLKLAVSGCHSTICSKLLDSLRIFLPNCHELGAARQDRYHLAVVVSQLLDEDLERDAVIVKSNWRVEVFDVRESLYANVGEQRCTLHFRVYDAVREEEIEGCLVT